VDSQEDRNWTHLNENR